MAKTGGNYSRNKGRRNELKVRDAIRLEGYECDRIPLSGAAQGFKGDLRVRGGNLSGDVEVEVKSRKLEFLMIYELLNANDGVGNYEHKGVLMRASYSFSTLFDNKYFVYFPTGHRPHKGVRKLYTCRKLIGTSKVLVVKNDGRRPIYIRYD